MSTPMFEIPEHVGMGVNKNGQGPVDEADPEYDRTVCWCGTDGCMKFDTAAMKESDNRTVKGLEPNQAIAVLADAVNRVGDPMQVVKVQPTDGFVLGLGDGSRWAVSAYKLGRTDGG